MHWFLLLVFWCEVVASSSFLSFPPLPPLKFVTIATAVAADVRNKLKPCLSVWGSTNLKLIEGDLWRCLSRSHCVEASGSPPRRYLHFIPQTHREDVVNVYFIFPLALLSLAQFTLPLHCTWLDFILDFPFYNSILDHDKWLTYCIVLSRKHIFH